ncbi:hypothetical protein Arub01_41440 [Actinomadura rubrobrunea]|uniref:SecDF P1 head subdomain domain-containing protein n=1 Tax=Actinomadura rubrobrunea TaxID=115335 RepID=A0A9W6UYN7_9ACTN|nr:hypothetical protein [Actinomadura rubrobrunea]GLW65900.1 hypothetical protein Arub01_41440 [Actinomadura rubrobrunea]
MRVIPRRSRDRDRSRVAVPGHDEQQSAAAEREPPSRASADAAPSAPGGGGPDGGAEQSGGASASGRGETSPGSTKTSEKTSERRGRRRRRKKKGKARHGQPAPHSERAEAPAQPVTVPLEGERGVGLGMDRPGFTTLPGDPDSRRRARAAARLREAAEVKRSRAAYRRRYADAEQAARAHRSALLVMVVTLGLLIAAVAVSGAMIAASMRTRPVALAAPLQIFPVTHTTPGQCPAGTPGVTGQTASGPTCYRLAQGIAIREVAELRTQRNDDSGAYDVAMTLRKRDRAAFAELTRATVGRDLAFVVRDRLVTAPRVDMPILDGRIVITGSADRAQADRLVRDLKGR